MRKRLLILFLTIVSAVCLCIGISACGNSSDSSVNGTYYKYSNGSYDYSSYFVLIDWSDDSDSSGTYTVSGTTIVFYTELFGENVEFVDGTISDGVLTYYIVNTAYTYCIDGKTPSGDTESGGSGGGSVSSQYTVTYDANGGTFAYDEETYTQTVSANSTLTAPTSPTREGYSFAGWATSKNGSTMWSFSSDKVTADITLYASWTEKSAAILSVDNASIDGENIFMFVDSSDSLSLSSMVTCSSDSTWKLYYDELGQTEIPTRKTGTLSDGDNYFYIVVTSIDSTIVNSYVLDIYVSYAVNVKYYNEFYSYYYHNSPLLLKTVTAYTGYTFNADYIPSITGYTFNYWAYSDGTAFTAKTLWGNLSLYASKTANDYMVTYDVNGGDELTETTATVTYDSSYTLIVPTRANYTFIGWYLDNTQLTNNEGASLSAWNYSSGKTLTAMWTPNNYTVTLNCSDRYAGTVIGSGSHSYTSSVTITATTNSGYTWVGWYDGETLLSSELSYTFTMPAENVTYTAKWTYYTLTTSINNIEAGTATSFSGEKITAGESVTLTSVTNDGYTFLGWYNGETLLTTKLTYTLTMPDESVTYTAKWTYYTLTISGTDGGTVNDILNSATVTFDLNGGSGNVESQTVTATTGLVYPDIPTYSGYVFRGWFTDSTCTTVYDFTAEVTSDITLYAGWQAMETSYYAENIIDITSDYNSSSSAYSFSTIGTSSTDTRYTYFSAYTSETYYIYYKNSSTSSSYGTYLYIYNATQGTVIKSASKITSTSYASVSFTAEAGDVICIMNSRYSSDYPSTFYLYVTGGSLPDDGGLLNNGIKNDGNKITAGESITVTATTNSGYTWVGWYNGETLLSTDLSYTFTMPYESVTYTAKWSKIT